MTHGGAPLLSVRQLRIQHALPGPWPWSAPLALRAVDELSFDLRAGEALGLVGESGCGKSTLARALVGLQSVTAGSIRFDGHELAGRRDADWRALRRQVQLVFQDPVASLDPRLSTARSVEAPLRALCPELDAAQRRRRVAQLLERVGLDAALHSRRPHELSGGQCQRVGIARALAVQPRLLVCDEAVAALDAATQAAIVDLLRSLRAERGLALIFISHDLPVVRQLVDRVLVMYFGRAVEHGPAAQVFDSPRHPYTRALLAAAPGADRATRAGRLLEGELPSALSPPPGCALATRCPMADEQCARRPPVLRPAGGSAVACHYA